MSPLRTALLFTALLAGSAGAAQAASFDCGYRINSGPHAGGAGNYLINADTGEEATNRALATLNQQYGPVAFSLQCRAL